MNTVIWSFHWGIFLAAKNRTLKAKLDLEGLELIEENIESEREGGSEKERDNVWEEENKKREWVISTTDKGDNKTVNLIVYRLKIDLDIN